MLNKTPQSLQDVSILGQGDQRIKITHVYKDFDTYNGLIDCLLILAKHNNYERYNLRLCVFNYNGGSYGKEFERLGGKIYNLKVGWKNNPLIILKLAKYFKSEKPEVVITHGLKPNLFGRLAAKIADVPIVIGTILTLKDTAFSRLRRLRDRFLHPINGYLNRISDKVIVNSNAIRKEWDPHCKSSNFEVIYFPFSRNRLIKDDEEFTVKDMLFLKGKNKKKIGVVARLSEEKGLEYLIRSMPTVLKKFSNIMLYIAGTGKLENKLKTLAKSLKVEDNVTFLGHLNNVFSFLAHIDIFVLPSRSESLPVAIMEAMSAGLPVISTSVGGIPEIIENGKTGILLPPRNSDELAKAIIYLLSNPNQIHKMGVQGKKVISEKFNTSEFIKRFEAVYKNLLYQKGIVKNL